VAGVRLLARIETLMLPLDVFPLAGADSQLPPLVVAAAMLNGMELPLLALTVRPCAAGSEPAPTMLKVSELSDTCSVGSAATTKVAGMVKGLLVAPADVSVMVPLYELGVKPARAAAFTEPVIPGEEAEVVALPGATASQVPPVVVAARAV